MARRSSLLPQQPISQEASPLVEEVTQPKAGGGVQAAPTKHSRMTKIHIGAYFDPAEQTIMAFQKLKVDLRRSQQDMLAEAIADFVAKQEAERAFK